MSLPLMLASLAGSGGGAKVYVDDVFVSYIRTGTGADVVVTTGIDMTKGYCLHSKGRSGATDHAVYNSERGVTKDLVTNSTGGETTQVTGLKAVSTTGHTIGSLAKMNTVNETYVDWVFKNADKFYNHSVVTKPAGSNVTFSFPGLGTLGRVRVKRTDAAGSWYEWHRSLSAGQLLIGESTTAAATLGHVTVSGTTVTLVNGVIADGTYLVEAWAHDTSAEGMIQCGSFTTDGSGNATVNLGWEPQYVLVKRKDSTSDWTILDTMRGYSNYGNDPALLANTTSSEVTYGGLYGEPNATGFRFSAFDAVVGQYIYLAIRRPNKPPTSGTQVYNAIARTGTGAAATVSCGFAPDLVSSKVRFATVGWVSRDRLRGNAPSLRFETTGAEGSASDAITEFGNDGVKIGADATEFRINQNTVGYINHFFRRAPGFFDVVCYAGTGVARTVNHNLGVAPELMIVKNRSNTESWAVYHVSIPATQYLRIDGTGTPTTNTNVWNSAAPTSIVFSVGSDLIANASTDKFVAYLFATLPGISKVGSYTGNGGSQTINCGFTAGARFLLIKRTDSNGDWFVWDTARGIIAANDPHLSLNTTAAEVTTDDSVDPDSSGFIINQNAATNINVTSANYIFLAIA